MCPINELYQKHVALALQEKQDEDHNLLNKDKIHQKILAFLSEVGKLSEESRCFSFWDSSPSDNQELLSFYINGLQLVLSIGYDLKIDSIHQSLPINQKNDLISQFLKVYDTILLMQKSYRFEDYQKVIDDYVTLGFLLQFDIDEIIQAYKENV